MYANGSSVTLRWNAVSGAYRYHVMVCTSSSFTSGCLDTDGGSLIGMEPSPGATSLTFTLPSTSGVCYTYYWKVRGIAYTNYGGWSSYSSSRYIRTY
jgi:hypothetical protein